MAAGGHTGGHNRRHGYAVCQDTGTSLGPPQTFSTAEPKHAAHVTYHPHVSGGYVPRIPPQEMDTSINVVRGKPISLNKWRKNKIS